MNIYPITSGKSSSLNTDSISMNTNVTNNKEAIQGLMAGMKIAADVAKVTYGPKGKNVLIEHEQPPYHVVANDFQTIIQSIHVEDKVQKVGLEVLKELSEKVNKDSADGRKTSALIAYSILEQAYQSDLSGMELKRELDSLIPLIEEKINEQKRNITVEEVHSVASIAGESEFIGTMLGRIYRHIGREGIIIPEPSGVYESSFSFIEGVRFTGTGYLSPYMVHDEEATKENRKETKAVYEKPVILVTKNKINRINDLDLIFNDMFAKSKKDLVIFTDDMDSEVARELIKNHRGHKDEPLKYPFNILIIKAPVLWKNYVFEDFAKVVGATIIEDSAGIKLPNIPLSALGTCDNIEVDKDETIILGGADISDHISELQKSEDPDAKLRLSWLTTKTAILKLGANNESELFHKRLKCYDAINSSKLALKDGVVQGGGICLDNIANYLPSTVSGQILKNALKEPLKQNLQNIGIAFADFSSEVIDAAAVVKASVRNAIALASTVLTTGIVITLPPKPKEEKKSLMNF